MNKDDLKPGMLVQLKSGGPRLTVQTVDQGLTCCWFDDGGNLRQGVFAPATVEPDGVSEDELLATSDLGCARFVVGVFEGGEIRVLKDSEGKRGRVGHNVAVERLAAARWDAIEPVARSLTDEEQAAAEADPNWTPGDPTDAVSDADMALGGDGDDLG